MVHKWFPYIKGFKNVVILFNAHARFLLILNEIKRNSRYFFFFGAKMN